MGSHTLNTEMKKLLKGLGVLLATSIQYSNLRDVYNGNATSIQAIKGVKGDDSFDILNYTKAFLEDVQSFIDLESEIEVIFEGFMTEASVVPCEKSELKDFFQLMYKGMKQKK